MSIEFNPKEQYGELSEKDQQMMQTSGPCNSAKLEIPQENSEPTNEIVLTPEITKQIMSKVQDIDRYGTAFTSLSFLSHGQGKTTERITDILRKGLLGNIGTGKKYEDINARLGDWRQKIHNRDFGNAMVWFNIVGRMRGIWGKHQIKSSAMIVPGGIGIVLDVSNFQELPPWKYREIQSKPEKRKMPISKTFSIDQPRGVFYFTHRIIDAVKNSMNPNNPQRSTFKPYATEGFLTPYRISPRFFRGLIIGGVNPFRLGEKFAQETIKPLVKSMTVVYSQSPDKWLPIYDSYGDLLWPQKMSYKEVKQFLSERAKMMSPEQH